MVDQGLIGSHNFALRHDTHIPINHVQSALERTEQRIDELAGAIHV